jgi:hypothetical protein
MFGDNWQGHLNLDYFSGQITGSDVINDVLAGPLIIALPESDRKPFIQNVVKFVDQYPDKAAFDTKFAIPLGTTQEAIIAAYGEEERRRMGAHKRFTDAMVELRKALLRQALP